MLVGLSAVYAEDGGKAAVEREQSDAYIGLAECEQARLEGKAFLEKFYQEGAECWFDNAFLKRNLTPNALKYLHDAYPYDDDSGDGLAMWLFYQEGGWDLGELKEVLVKEVADNTYRVTCRSRFNEDTYEYTVVFGLVKVGNAWKIDTMKPGKGDLVVSDSGIQDGSRWNIASLDYTAKVNADKTITFNAMAEGEELMFRLTPSYSKQNEYVLSDEPGGDGFNPFSGSPRVKLIDKQGWKLLCLYDRKGRLQNILDGTQMADGEKVAMGKWMQQLMGYYTTSDGDTLQIGMEIIYEHGVARAEYKNLEFNGNVTGVMSISGLTHLEGLWEVVQTLGGLNLYSVKQDDYGMFKRTGQMEILAWVNTEPRFGYARTVLLNDGQFRKLSKSTLRIMRNAILAGHGYMVSSPDLVEYFGSQPWFAPRPSNDGVFDELSLVEQLNIELIKAEEAKPDDVLYVKEL